MYQSPNVVALRHTSHHCQPVVPTRPLRLTQDSAIREREWVAEKAEWQRYKAEVLAGSNPPDPSLADPDTPDGVVAEW